MKIKEQTRKLAAGCSKNSFETVDKAKPTWFDEIFEEYSFTSLSLPQLISLY